MMRAQPVPPERIDLLEKKLARPGGENNSTRAGPSPKSAPALTAASDITPAAIEWLWPKWLPKGKFVLLAGSPGSGKTTIAMDIAARISQGGTWPDGNAVKPGTVIIMSTEDDPADTLVPRLMAAGANLDNIKFINWSESTRRTLEQIERERPTLLIVDPITALPEKFDSHNNAETRRALQPFSDTALRAGTTILAITHFAKNSGQSDPLDRVIGSLAFGAVARVVLVAGRSRANEESSKRVLTRAKSNIGPDGGGFNYDIEEVAAAPGIPATRASWGAPVKGSAWQLLREDESPEESSGIEGFIRGCLGEGAMESKKFKVAAEESGYPFRTVQRHARKMGAICRKRTFVDGWEWHLPSELATNSPKASNSPGLVSGEFASKASPPAGDEFGEFDELE